MTTAARHPIEPRPAGLLRGAAAEGARRLLGDQLARLRRAARRLDVSGDHEALHDFRVAARRLRSLLRAFGTTPGVGIGRGARRSLRELTKATNAGRDAEVGLEIVRRLVPDPGAAERRGLEPLVRALEDRRDRALAEARRTLIPGCRRLDARLGRRLRDERADSPLPGAEPTASFRETVLAGLIADRRALSTAIERARSSNDPSLLHRVRIRGKRLRYLIEPLRDELNAAAPAIARLRSLQDALGELNDLAVLAAAIAPSTTALRRELSPDRASGDAASGSKAREPESGLAALARAIDRERELRAARAHADWIAVDGEEHSLLLRALDDLAEEMTAT